MSSRRSALDPLRARVRSIQLIIGVAVVARVGGALITSVLVTSFPGKGTLPPWLGHPVGVLIEELWAWAVLPLLLYLAARIVPLRPWRAAVATVVLGFGTTLSLQFLTLGWAGVRHEHPARWLAWAGVLGAAVALGRLAIVRGSAAAAHVEGAARAEAEMRHDEYAEFTREAERLGARHEAREAEARSREAVAPAPSGDAAPESIAQADVPSKTPTDRENEDV